MNSKTILYLGYLILPAFLFSCYSTEVSDSSHVSQKEIHQNYFVYVDAEANSSGASAIFRFESWQGNSLDLAAPSQITLNGTKMTGDKEFLTGFVYRRTRIENSNNTYVFEFTDTEKKKYTNTMKLNPISLRPIPEGIHRSEGFKLDWVGESVGTGEDVTVTLTMNDTITVSLSNSTKGGMAIEFRPEDFTTFIPGITNLLIVREIEKNLDEATNVEGTMSGKYSSEIIAVEILD